MASIRDPPLYGTPSLLPSREALGEHERALGLTPPLDAEAHQWFTAHFSRRLRLPEGPRIFVSQATRLHENHFSQPRPSPPWPTFWPDFSGPACPPPREQVYFSGSYAMPTSESSGKSTDTNAAESNPKINGTRKPPRPTGDFEQDALQSGLYYGSALSPEAHQRVLTYLADKAGFVLAPKATGTPPSKPTQS